MRGISGGRWVWKRRQPRHQDGDAGDNAVSVVARRTRGSLPADNAKVFAQVTMHFDEEEAVKLAVESMGYRSVEQAGFLETFFAWLEERQLFMINFSYTRR